MLGRIGIKVDLLAQIRSIFFAKVLAQGGYDTSFYMFGWTSGSFDTCNVLYNLVYSRTEDAAGALSLGGYANPEIDEAAVKILTETDPDKRAAMNQRAWQIVHNDAGYPPLHQQALSWAGADGLRVAQRADNQFASRHLVKN